ncbi:MULTISPECIES: hypothetical protein [Cellulomonas]|uniref:Uncharacterized protein n=2 Tax=Cellulomonas TaxID=1707 RepID=A0A401V3W5_9CELL|nr:MULTISPECIES: hypothetical protein [Cellulomonas]NKY39827.1 hypothetical protein [Cellulomonas septica]GCD21594.1 hypothetical protein CTKZ_31560 [Cellulomonas algicola]
MTTFWILVALAAAAWWVTRLVLAVRGDGLGTTPPPSSHADWSDATSDLPSEPFRVAG